MNEEEDTVVDLPQAPSEDGLPESVRQSNALGRQGKGLGFNPQQARRQLFGGDGPPKPASKEKASPDIEALVDKFMQAGSPKANAENPDLDQQFRSFLQELGGGDKKQTDGPPTPPDDWLEKAVAAQKVGPPPEPDWLDRVISSIQGATQGVADYRKNRPAMQKKKQTDDDVWNDRQRQREGSFSKFGGAENYYKTNPNKKPFHMMQENDLEGDDNP